MKTPEGVAHAEPDSTPGEEINLNAPAHLESAGPEVLMDAEEDRPYVLKEDGTTRGNASVGEDRDPRIELQEPGVSHLTTQEKAGSLTLSSPMPPTTSEAARTQRSPAVNAGTSANPERDRGADLEPPPHDPALLNEAAESTDHPPQQIQAHARVEGPLESLRGEEPRDGPDRPDIGART